jgi:uncharacterized membrane protein
MKLARKEIIQIAVMVALYILLGNSRSIQPNPVVPGAVIAINMIVPVLAGILFGRQAGFVVGILGTTLNSFFPASTAFEIAAIAPHGIMGFAAGWLKQRAPAFIASGALIIGHLLNILMFVLLGLMKFNIIIGIRFWYGLGYEIIVGMLAVIIIVAIYNLAFMDTLRRK